MLPSTIESKILKIEKTRLWHWNIFQNHMNTILLMFSEFKLILSYAGARAPIFLIEAYRGVKKWYPPL